MTPAFLKSCRYLIAASLAIAVSATAGDNRTRIGANLAALVGVPYDAYSGKLKTESGQSASCVSVVTYGLNSIGYRCAYTGFRKYFNSMSQHAKVLEIGVTPFPWDGAIVFDHEHFTVTYRDQNLNGIIDGEDEIIHAPFGPVVVSTINEWLHNRRDDIYVVPIGGAISCPQS